MDEQNYWLGFSAFPGVGPIKFQKLLEHFGSAKNAWENSQRELEKVLGPVTAQKFVEFRNSFSIEKYVKELEQKQVLFITTSDDSYPKLLKQISNPPFVLYVKGNAGLLAASNWLLADGDLASQKREAGSQQLTIAVVGTRKITTYGRQVTELLTHDLVGAGFTIVSGLAMGVDACAHQATLENNGKTIAVLGCGVDCCYPSSNQKLYDEMLEKSSVIVSEFPLSMQPSPGSFPSRNRIIAGLSQAVLVTEGAADSGSLITAELALKFKRKVFAVPGPITSSLSVGPYKLLKQGAVLVSSAAEIIRELGFDPEKNRRNQIANSKKIGETEEEQMVINLLQNESLHFDELVRILKIDSAEVGSLLTLMEMKGMIKSLEGGNFALS